MTGTTTYGIPLAASPLGFQPAAYLGLLLIAAGTLAGAWSVRRWSRHGAELLLAACGVLLALAVVDLVPHAVGDTNSAGLPLWSVPASVVVGLVVVPACCRLLLRIRGGQAHGLGTAAALVLHRLVEGMTVVLLPSPAVVAALVVHSASEGLALTALLKSESRRRLAVWLGLACLSPLLGGLAAQVVPLPDAAHALLMGIVAGVLMRGGASAIALARREHLMHRPSGLPAVMAMGSALIVTAAAVLVLR